MPIDLGSGVLFEATTVGSGTGNYDSFLRLASNGEEEGYNTDVGGQLDNKDGIWTHSIQLSGMAIIIVDGIAYYEIRLDLNEIQSGDSPNITLTDLRIFYGAEAGADADPTFAGLTEVFDLEGSLDLVDTNNGSGTDDYRFLLPVSLFPDPSQYFTLYAAFSGSDDGFEEFRTQTVDFVAQPSIGVNKQTNGSDDDCPSVLVGSDVTWTYTVTNDGNIPLTGITLWDDNGTPGDTGDDFQPTYVSGDTNTDGVLDLTETWIYTYTLPAVSGEYDNIATASGSWSYGGATGTSTATEEDCYFGVDPSISIVKMTNGTDDECPAIMLGGDVTWTYQVTNTGNVAIENLVVTDDNGTPDGGDDFQPTYVSGDLNTNGILDVGESWMFSYSGTAVAGEYTNTATAGGSWTSDELSGEVEAEDDDCYFGADPGIEITKMTNGTDDDCPAIITGESVTWTYTVVNTGNVAIENVVLIDDNGTAGDTGDDFAPTLVSGDDNGNNILDVGETWNYGYTGTAGEGEYENIGSVAGDWAYSGLSGSVDDSEDDCYYGVNPAISIVKETNGTNDDCPTILVGSDVTWTYTITNDGNVAIENLVVSDDNGTPLDTGDDFAPDYVSGDDGNGILDVGESWVYSYSGIALGTGEYENIGSVGGSWSYGELSGSVDDNEDDCYFGANPDLEIVKLTNGTEDLCPVLSVGEDVTWTYFVTNTGNVALDNLVVVDDNGTPGDDLDDFNPDQVLSGGFNAGDTDMDGIFDPGEIWEYIATGMAVEGEYENTATASADFTDDFDNSANPSDSDSDCYVGLDGCVRTPGFWQNPRNGGQFWDGIVGNEKNAGKEGFADGELLYAVDSNGDGVIDGSDQKGLLIGDYNRDGLSVGEDTIFISYADARTLINANNKMMSDGVVKIGRDVVATWLNYLAGSAIGDESDTNSPRHYINDAIDFLQVFGDANPSNIDTNDTFDIYSALHAKVQTSTIRWTGDNSGDHSGAEIHDALDGYNNTGTINGIAYSASCDQPQYVEQLKGYAIDSFITLM